MARETAGERAGGRQTFHASNLTRHEEVQMGDACCCCDVWRGLLAHRQYGTGLQDAVCVPRAKIASTRIDVKLTEEISWNSSCVRTCKVVPRDGSSAPSLSPPRYGSRPSRRYWSSPSKFMSIFPIFWLSNFLCCNLSP